MKRGLLINIIILLICAGTNAQMSPKEYNLESFSDSKIQVTEEMRSLIPESFHDHPEFGYLPYDAPCDDCFELIHKRTDSTKLFVKKKSYGRHYFSQATYGLVHYQKYGYSMTYDPRLKEVSSGYYESSQQDTPTFIDLNNKFTGFKVDGEVFRFNNDLELILVNEDETEVSKGKANWSDYSIGEEGIYVNNAWEGVDLQITFRLDRIKTNYVIKEKLPYLQGVKFLKFSDQLVLPIDYHVIEGEDEQYDSLNNRYGNYLIKNIIDETVFKIDKAFGYDNSGVKENSRLFYYELDDRFNLYVPCDWLQSESIVYPIVIDPLVTSTATYTSGSKTFLYNGAFCSNSGGCTYSLSVPRPINSEIVGTTFGVQYNTGACSSSFTCLMQEAGFKLFSSCGESPATSSFFWTCNSPNPGTCSGTGIDVFAELGDCLGSTCTGNVVFQIENSYCFCDNGGGCGATCHSMPNNSWSVTLEGRTLETLGNTTTGNGFLSIFTSSCTGTTTLDPTPEYGVPGYTFNWSTGETTPTINVSNLTTGDTYTTDVTDACGNTVTATFEISCPLAVTLYDMTVYNDLSNVNVDWQTSSEQDNDYFAIERSSNGIDFVELGTVAGVGNSSELTSYSFVDKSPLRDISYYRLKIVDIDGEVEYSDIKSVFRGDSDESISLIPNPAAESVQVKFHVPVEDEYDLFVLDMMGSILFHKKFNLSPGMAEENIEISKLASGNYIVQVRSRSEMMARRLIVK